MSTLPTAIAVATGLKNQGNTCFMNVVLQSLASVRSMHSYLEHMKQTKMRHRQHNDFIGKLSDTLKALTTINATPITPPLTDIDWVRQRWCDHGQQDAQEFMHYIFSILDGDAFTQTRQPPFKSSETSKWFDFQEEKRPQGFFGRFPAPDLSSNLPRKELRNPFSGLMHSSLKCGGCGRAPILCQNFYDISLTIPESTLRQKSSCSLKDCLDYFTMEELITDADPCDSCFQLDFDGTPIKTQSRKRLAIARPPKSFCFHIRRLIQDDGGQYEKLKQHLEFPFDLDMSPYCTFGIDTPPSPTKTATDLSGQRLHRLASSIPGGATHFHQQHLNAAGLDSDLRSNWPQPEPMTESSQMYRLASVIVHHGGHSGGHYTVFRRIFKMAKEGYEKWLGMDDAASIDLDDRDNWVSISDETSTNVDLSWKHVIRQSFQRVVSVVQR
eukprot:TRINITY_DN4309_c0_g2_i2.p1 TRINITY_DN4309_c0_g2~~TRINITY_DN4309_c0_g2_i2.p1  ORF type:complete len:474 (-),score=59.80 TRINITY_DN4309_c0_g2_i2:32-1351(-)